ncbi:MAG TPA: prolipoprotein diacylglyceryl transferase family protein [Planctomycetota bacterium]
MFKFNFWSLAIGTGLVLGYLLALRRAKKAGIPEREFETGIWWALIVGFVVSRMVEVIFYRPDLLQTEGWITLFKVTEGISSYGGFLGGTLGLAGYYLYKRKRWWREADILVEAFMVGWVFGRLGCTVAGDHPGPRCAEAWWAFHYPDGPRHNLGFYEMLFTLLLIVPVNVWLNRRPQPEGRVLGVTCLIYGVCRFGLDFLRATDVAHPDPRYAGLTLAHYTSAAVALFGACLLFRRSRDTVQT